MNQEVKDFGLALAHSQAILALAQAKMKNQCKHTTAWRWRGGSNGWSSRMFRHSTNARSSARIFLWIGQGIETESRRLSNPTTATFLLSPFVPHRLK